MKRSSFLTGALAVLIFCGSVAAQTGPSSGDPVAPGNSDVPAVGQVLTPERLATLLKKDGSQVEMKKFQSGSQTIYATIVRDNWRFVVEFEFSPNQKNMHVLCALGNPAKSFPAEQLLELMKKSYQINPVHFSYRPSDQRICLEDPSYNTANMTDENVQQIVNNFLRIVRETHNLWDGKGAPIAANPAAPELPPPAPPAPKVDVKLANTIWVGGESLQGFGRLQFRFGPNGQVTMIDSAGQQHGTFTQAGNDVTMTFFGGRVTYTGTMDGQTISGQAKNATGASWDFSVSK